MDACTLLSGASTEYSLATSISISGYTRLLGEVQMEILDGRTAFGDRTWLKPPRAAADVTLAMVTKEGIVAAESQLDASAGCRS